MQRPAPADSPDPMPRGQGSFRGGPARSSESSRGRSRGRLVTSPSRGKGRVFDRRVVLSPPRGRSGSPGGHRGRGMPRAGFRRRVSIGGELHAQVPRVLCAGVLTAQHLPTCMHVIICLHTCMYPACGILLVCLLIQHCTHKQGTAHDSALCNGPLQAGFPGAQPIDI